MIHVLIQCPCGTTYLGQYVRILMHVKFQIGYMQNSKYNVYKIHVIKYVNTVHWLSHVHNIGTYMYDLRI